MTTDVFAVRIPDGMEDDDLMWRNYWTICAEAQGWAPTGEPTLARHEQATVNGMVLDPDGPMHAHIARGPVERSALASR